MARIKKAVIPAAGFGTRFLPVTKATPKEMLPIVDKPTIQYIVEEAAAAGIDDILIITNRGKGIIEDHFDHSPELEERLQAAGKTEELAQVRALAEIANIHFIRQRETKGLGHAVSCARAFVGDEPFAVLYGDDVIIGEDSACGQLCRVYEEFGRSVVGIKEVTPEQVLRYCSLAVAPVHDNIYRVSDMIEKPELSEAPSNIAVLGRYIISPTIFELLEHTAPGKGGEVQLTDALKQLALVEPVWAYCFEGKRYDVGDKLGFLKATVEFALRRPDLGGPFRSYLEELMKE